MKNINKKSGFFINLLGVILGILLTFGVNSLWQKREEKKRTSEMLILVRNELKDTKEWFNHQKKILKRDGYVYKKILEAKNDLTSIPVDTLNVYHKHAQKFTINSHTISAWQIFQNSEMIQKMKDKELVIRLAECYSAIILLHEVIMKDYWDAKMKMMSSLDIDNSFNFFENALKKNEYVFFFNLFSLDTSTIWNSFTTIEAFIDYTILLLDRHGNYRYDMDVNDNEFETFLKTKFDSVFLKKDTIEITKTISDEK